MICFADTDIILKLAACDLLPSALAALNITRHEVAVFREEAYRVYRHDADILTQYAPDARTRALKFINSAQGIFTAPDAEEQAYMEHAGIDSGEQIIFGATREQTDFQVVTADRKALRALAHAHGCGAICGRMRGRVLCVEHLLLRLISRMDFEALQARVSPQARHDAAFDAPFAAGKTQAEAETELQTRLDALRAQTGQLLAF